MAGGNPSYTFMSSPFMALSNQNALVVSLNVRLVSEKLLLCSGKSLARRVGSTLILLFVCVCSTICVFLCYLFIALGGGVKIRLHSLQGTGACKFISYFLSCCVGMGKGWL